MNKSNNKSNNKIYTLLSLFMIIAIDSLGVGLVWPLFGPLFMGHSETSIFSPAVSMAMRNLLYGVTIGAFPLCMFFGAPILGDLSDRVGRKRVLSLCLLGTAVGMGICALGVIWRHVYFLIIGRALLGILAGSQATAQAAIVDISTPQQKALNLGMITLASSLGFMLGPLLGGILINHELVSWFTSTTPFAMAAILALVNAAFLVAIFKDTAPVKKSAPMNFMKGAQIFIEAVTNADVRVMALAYFFMQTGWAAYYQFSVSYLVQFHNYNGTQVGHFLATLSFCYSFGLFAVMRIGLRYVALEKLVGAALTLAAVAFMTSTVHKEWVTWASMVPAAIGEALAYSGLLTLLSNCVSAERQGWAMGIAGAMSAVAWGGGALLAGALGIFDSPIVFFAAAASMLTSLGLVVRQHHRATQM